jgi:transcriptional regulator with XRE-family HTH domain
MKLAEWLVSRGVSQNEFSKEFGVSQATISFWVNAEQPPSGANMMKLYRMTNGKVALKDWCEEFGVDG